MRSLDSSKRFTSASFDSAIVLAFTASIFAVSSCLFLASRTFNSFLVSDDSLRCEFKYSEENASNILRPKSFLRATSISSLSWLISDVNPLLTVLSTAFALL